MSIYEAWLREEIDFWLRFIEEWEQKHQKPAPFRMRAALQLAEEKLAQYLDNADKMKGQSTQAEKVKVSVH